MYGALTYIFIEVIKQNPSVTYAQLLEFLSETFDENAATQVKCLNSRTLARLFGHKISQVYIDIYIYIFPPSELYISYIN